MELHWNSFNLNSNSILYLHHLHIREFKNMQILLIFYFVLEKTWKTDSSLCIFKASVDVIFVFQIDLSIFKKQINLSTHGTQEPI